MELIQAVKKGQKIPTELKEMMDHNQLLFEGAGFEYKLIRFDCEEDPAVCSEKLRCELAIENPTMIWADWDVRFNSLPTFAEDNVYFSFCGKAPQNPVFYVNNHPEEFAGWLRYIKINNPGYGKCNRYLNRDPRRWAKFPEVYEHLMYTMKK